MENTLADQAARREQVAGRPVTARHHRLAIPAQLPSDVATFTGRTQYLADLGKLPPSHEPARDKHHRGHRGGHLRHRRYRRGGKTALAVH